MKRFLGLVLAFVMVFGLIPMNIFAAGAEADETMAAQVGETAYATLAEAVTAANAVEGGAAVELLKDVTLSEALTVSGSVTIRGDHTITRGFDGALFTVESGAALTLDGGLVIDGGVAYTAAMFVIHGSMTMNNAVIQNRADASVFSVSEGAALTITDGIISDLEAIRYLAPGLGLAENEDGTYTVTDRVAEVGGEIYGSVAAAEAAVTAGGTISMLANAPVAQSVIVDQETVIDLNGNGIYAAAENVYPIVRVTADVTVTGEGGVDAMKFGTGYAFIVGSGETAGSLTIKSGSHYGTTTVASVTKGTLKIEGGYFEATPYTDENDVAYGHRYTLNCIDSSYNAGTAAISVSGGTFYDFNPENNLAEGDKTNFCAEFCHATEIPAAAEGRLSTWAVAYDPSVDYVACIEDGAFFMDLSDALDAAAEGNTVQLLKDCQEASVLVPAGVILDLNGNVVETKVTLSFGSVIDTAVTVGGIRTDIDTTKAFTKLQPGNGGYLPIYDTDCGQYKFYKCELKNAGSKTEGNAVKFGIQILFENMDAYTVLTKTGNSGIRLNAKLSWSGMTIPYIDYEFNNEKIKEYAEKRLTEPTKDYAIILTLGGLDYLSAGSFVSAVPAISTITEVAMENEAIVHTVE